MGKFDLFSSFLTFQPDAIDPGGRVAGPSEQNAPDNYFLPPDYPGPSISALGEQSAAAPIEPAGPQSQVGAGSISIAALGTPVTENFNTLASSGTSSILPLGWYFNETGTNADGTYAAGTGSSGVGNTYSFGASGSTERAFGSLFGDAFVKPTIGAAFTNNTGATITNLTISYTGEQWRIGNTSHTVASDRFDFQYSLDATSLTTGSWTDIDQLDFLGPIMQAGSAAALNGNAAANQVAISFTITGLSIAPGTSIFLRWTDVNGRSVDDGLAIDDFSITASDTPNAEPSAVNIEGDLVVYTEDQPGPALLDLGSDATVSDLNSVDFAGGTLTVAITGGLVAGEDELYVRPGGPVTASATVVSVNFAQIATYTGGGAGGAPLVFTFDTDATPPTPATISALIRAIAYRNSDTNNPTEGVRTITWTLVDGDGTANSGDDTLVFTSSIEVEQNSPGAFSINDVTLGEGDSGTTPFTFTITRSGGSDGAADVSYTVAAPGGAGFAGSDDFAGGTSFSGIVSFANGETSRQITLNVVGDTVFETAEAFTVTLSDATGGATIADGEGVGTISNDDPVPPAGSISIADATIVEGNAGTQTLVLTVTRTGGTAAFAVDYTTSDGGTPGNASATAGSDYLASSGTLSFAEGQNSAIISITVNGDTAVELSEEFTVTLSGATNGATISDPTGVATIGTDDPLFTSVRIFEEDFTDFAAAGFAPNPSAAQLDSDIWRVAGLGDNANPGYGLTLTTGDFARGLINTSNPTTAGVFSPSASNGALIVQATGAEFDTNGFIEARIENTSGGTATGFDIGFDWAFRNNEPRSSNLTFSYSTDGVNFTAVPAAAFSTPAAADAIGFTTQNRTVSLGGLSVAAGEYVYLRWTNVSTTGSGNRDEVGIDNVTVDATGVPAAPRVAISDVSVNEAAGTMTFTVNRTNVAAGAFTVDYATANGTATAGVDYAAASGTLSFAENQVSQTVTVNIVDDPTPETNETLFLNLSNASGATIVDGQGLGTIANDDGDPIQVSIGDVSIVEGDSGTSLMTFTITRTGGTGQFDISFQTLDGTATSVFADPDRDYQNTSGTTTFLAGVNSRTFTVEVYGDARPEENETFSVQLFGATNDAVIVDGTGIGTIVNDDLTLIHDIQGSAYFSPILLGDGINNFNLASTTIVTVQAVITAVDTDGNRTGFYITEENGDWDSSLGTSEGIFVMFTNDAGTGTLAAGASTPALSSFQVGDLVTVTARVMEYQSFSNMPVTVLTLASEISRDATNQSVPTFLLDSSHPIPNGILTAVTPNYLDGSDDVGDTFDYSLYALSYFETVESMLVTIPNMRAADGFVTPVTGGLTLQAYSTVHATPGQINDRGGYTIDGDPALSPPNTATVTDDVRYGGRIVHDGDTNPDIIELDFTDFAISPPDGLVNATMGDVIGNVTGIIGFDFTDRKLYVTGVEGFNVNAINNNTPARETAEFSSSDDPRQLTIATFNVENLTANDPNQKFLDLAAAIVTNLRLPDILSIEEIQDNNGTNSSGGADATATWTALVNAVNAAAAAVGSNAVYQWVDQEPVAGAEGGAGGANIRVGFLYNTTRVQLGDLPANATIEQRRQWTDRLGDGVRDANDLIQFDDSMIVGIETADYTTTRKSLLGQFTFNGQTVFVLANHLPAKSGSGSFWQFNQTLESGQPANSDWAQRNAIGEDIFNLANHIQTNAPNAGFIAGGDFNDFQFTRALEAATGYVLADGTARTGVTPLLNMTLTLDPAERYTYTFDGRSQAIDHILVNSLLAAGAAYDIVHLNTGYGDGSLIPISDHDPTVVRLDMRGLSETLSGTGGDDLIDLSQGGNDTVNGGAGNDGFYFGAAYTSADVVDGGAGTLDQIGLQGNYTGGSAVTLGSLLNTELVVLLAGDDNRFGGATGTNLSYAITAGPGTIVSNGLLTIQANALRVGENLTFNGAGSSASFLIFAGAGNNSLTGGTSDDGFFFGDGHFGAGDLVIGGDGSDQLGLQGNYTGPSAISFGAGQLSGIEFIVLLSAADSRFGTVPGNVVAYDITMSEGNVLSGDRLVVSANTLAPTESLTFDGSDETDGSFAVYSGGCQDVIIGSQNADLIYGGGGDDVIIGLGGADILFGDGDDTLFVYFNPEDSTDAERDQIRDFDSGDLIDLQFLGSFIFTGDSAGGPGEVTVSQTGNDAVVRVYMNGDSTADLVISVTVADGYVLSADDFVGVASPPGQKLITDMKPAVMDTIIVDPAPTDWHLPEGLAIKTYDLLSIAQTSIDFSL